MIERVLVDVDLLSDLLDYLDGFADADCSDPYEGYFPNKAMRLMERINDAIVEGIGVV